MLTSINRTVFDIPLTWDRTSFEASRVKCRQARKLIDMSINAQFNKQLKDVFFQKLDIEKDITESQERLVNQEKKVRVLDNLTEVAAQSLTDYFDKRMENVRTAIQEHCNAIQLILCEENEHWKEIHTAIDQNLITSDDIHPPNNVDEELPIANIHTINEVDEEEHTSQLLNNKTVTPLLTQIIRKSRMQSYRHSVIEPQIPSSTEILIQSKEERFSVIIPLNSARRTLPVIDTTFVVKLEESKSTELDTSDQVEVVPMESLPSTHVEVAPMESLPSTHVEVAPMESLPSTHVEVAPMESLPSTHLEVAPMESIPTTEVDATPSYSQPKLPARLYFSPTLLIDDDEPEPIQAVLSTIDQNQSNIEKPRIIPRRFGQTFLLDNIKTEEINKSQDTENIRPTIPDEIPFIINCDPSLLMEKQTLNESHHSEILEHQKSIVYSKRRTRAAATAIKVESEPMHVTRRATRNQNQTKETNTNKRQTRKRKQSISDDGNNNTVTLRKKKAVAPPPKTNTRKTRVKKTKDLEIPIREPSPLPIIDRSKHYSTRFSTRSHRFNNLTLSTTTMIENDDNNNKSKHSSTRLRTKSVGRPRKHDNDGADQIISTTRLNINKNQPKTRAKSTMVTRNRRK